MSTAIEKLRNFLSEPVAGHSALLFRWTFGLVMALACARFFYHGWIEQFYESPQFSFKYWGFSWVPVPKGAALRLLFASMGLLALLVAWGRFHHLAMPAFFLVFAWIELLDVTNYLNHYYLITVLALLMSFMPVGKKLNQTGQVPRWVVWTLRGQFGIVYFFAGVAKLKYDWLFLGEPLHTWMLAKADVLGPFSFLAQRSFAIAGSWAAALFDLSIVFFLFFGKTRPIAFAAVLIFHGVTGYLFPIGLFPYLMVAGASLFFAPAWPQKYLKVLKVLPDASCGARKLPKWGVYLLTAHFTVQILLPFRHHLYSGPVTWHEQGMRFAWNVMLVEKAGIVRFTVKTQDGRRLEVSPDEFVQCNQKKMMSTQPDLILQLAHHIGRKYQREFNQPVSVYADSYVSRHGRPSRRLIDPSVDLMQQRDSLFPKAWVLP